MKRLSVLVVAITLSLVLALVIDVHVVPHASSSNPQSLSNRLDAAANFTEELFNPAKGLCRETLVGEMHNITASNGKEYQCFTNETYWIASDNYLESLALKNYNATLSEIINKTCSSYYNGSYFPYQIMNGDFIPFTLYIPNTYVMKNDSDQIVALNLYNGTPRVNDKTFTDYPKYGDTLVYEALNYYVQGYPLNWSDNLYMHAYNMFDGKGVADAHFQNTSQYDNMKLALLIFGAKVLNLNVNLTAIEQQLWNAQKTSGVEIGGVTAVDDIAGLPNGTANGETTVLTLLAYDDNLISQIQLEGEQARKTAPQDSVNVTLPATTFNQTNSTTNNLAAIPLLSNWKAIINNTVVWALSEKNPCVVLGFYSSLASPKNLSIQIVEYNNDAMDVVIHNATYPNGHKINPPSLNWVNPLNVSLMSGNLTISGSSGVLFAYRFQEFDLAYITGGSTQADVCSGGEVQVRTVPELSPVLIIVLFMVSTLLAVMARKKVARARLKRCTSMRPEDYTYETELSLSMP